MGARWTRVLGLGVAAALLSPTRGAPGYSQAFFCFYDRDETAPGSRCQVVVGAFAQIWRDERDGRSTSYMPPYAVQPAVEREVMVVGHAQDGADDERVSAERTRQVVALLEAAGVPSRLIRAEGRGHRDLLVPDDDDPQNRRVQIWSR